MRLLAGLAATLTLAAAPPFDKIRSSIEKRIAADGAASIAIAVARDGEIIWEEAFGWADRERRAPATPHTMYSLASISKPFTATGLMVLKEQGRIDLDKPVNDYLGEAKVRARVGNAADATIRRVANHSSGLPLHYQFFYEDEPHRPPPREETIRRYANLITPPGERYQYSNLGYGILDHVITRVSGKSYADFMREFVFLPLGLTRTSVGIGPRLNEFQAIRYERDGTPIPFYDFDHPGGSAVYASAHDLARFAMFHLKAHLPDQKAILSDAAIEEMQKPTVEIRPGSGYGIGWAIEDSSGGYRIVSHTGGMGGVNTVLWLLPAKRAAIAVLANSNSSLPYALCEEIARVIAPDFGSRPPSRRQQPQKFQPSDELSGHWKGLIDTYTGQLGFQLEIRPSGDIHARVGDQLETLVNQPQFRDGCLTGRLAADIGTPDANRRPYWLELELKLRGRSLAGGITALSRPSRRAGNALTYWAELKKD